MSTGVNKSRSGQMLFLHMVTLCCVLFSSNVGRAYESPQYTELDGESIWTIERLTTLFAKIPDRHARFVETYYSSLFKEPLKTEGELTFTAPSKVEKLVLVPFEERYLVDGDTLMLESREKGTTKTLSLNEYPFLRVFIESFRSVMAGDLETLQKFYDVHLFGEQSGWVVMLRPLGVMVRERVAFIRLTGIDDVITLFEVRESNGDRSEMVITSRDK